MKRSEVLRAWQFGGVFGTQAPKHVWPRRLRDGRHVLNQACFQVADLQFCILSRSYLPLSRMGEEESPESEIRFVSGASNAVMEHVPEGLCLAAFQYKGCSFTCAFASSHKRV